MPSPALSDQVSVVIPAYNYAHFLPEAIASVLAQTWADFELIIIDDGSTDTTPDVCARYTDPRVRTVRQPNAGLSAARNTGLREARFPFVAFLDADDRWEPCFLASVLREFHRLGPSFVAVGTGCSRMNASGEPLPPPRQNFLQTGELTTASFCLRNRPLSSSIVIRRDVFDECGHFDTALRSSEDRDMWIRIAARGHRFYYLGEPLVAIRRHPQNMSKNAPRMKRNSGLVLRRAWRSGAVARWRVLFWLRAASIHYFLVAWTHFDDGLRARAWLYLLASILLWPVFLRAHLVAEPPLFRLRALAYFLRTHP
ncbi:MAG: glycosyltransferase family A protein [Chthoniobacter sp.]|nr:glycosyltransferase family A protein [Chthoniobacter sp.]